MTTQHDNTEYDIDLDDDVGSWHWTPMRDWIAVCPDISPVSVRLYWIMRSLLHEKGDRRRRLSLDQMRWLLPGVNGKATSKTRVEDALAELKQAGLLSNPDGDVTRRWVTDPATGKQTRENYRRWRIHDLPADSYGGWRNARDKLDAYPGPGWDKAQVNTDTRNSGPQSSPAETDVSAGRTETRNSGNLTRNSDDFEAVPTTNGGSKEAVVKKSFNQPPPTPRAEPAPDVPVTDEREGEAETLNNSINGGGGNRGHLAAARDEVLGKLEHPWTPGRRDLERTVPEVAAALDEGWDADPLIACMTRTRHNTIVRDYQALLRDNLANRPIVPNQGFTADTSAGGVKPGTAAPCPREGHKFERETSCGMCIAELRDLHKVRGDWRVHGSIPHVALATLNQQQEARDAA